MIAGARCGSPIGTPLTFKYLNVSGIRHTAQPMITAAENIVQDFDPDTQYEDAIKAGVCFLERPQTGGFRLLLDSTCYGVDDNWLWNRANSIYAGDVAAYNFRNRMENIYIGKKNTVTVGEVTSTADSILREYLAQGITVASAGASVGYKDLVIKKVGNTFNISVTLILVEGIDFCLVEFTLARAS
jgi:hypothetical protein